MAVLTVQELPTNGATAGEITFTAADVAGDTFVNTGREIYLVAYGGTATGTVEIEGVPSADSGRDGSSVIATATSGVHGAGPFKPRNFSNAGVVDVSYPGGITDITVAVIRFTTG